MSADHELVVRGATVVAPDGTRVADVGVAEGRITALALSLGGSAAREIDGTGLHLLPGGIDAHVHCNEPGRTSWEGFWTASSALAAGGMTAFFDMPLNASPPTVDAASFDLKLQHAQASSRLDFALWGGIVPGNLGELAALHERGAIGFKAFMSEPGLDDFRRADDVTLLEGMRRCAELGAIVAVHAESDELTRLLTRRAQAAGRTTARDYLASRPVVAEVDAIARASTFAHDAGCALHVVHVSSARGLEEVARARRDGVDVTCEVTCHHLALTEADVERLGTIAKCAPPLRPSGDRERLWEWTAHEPGAIVTSDHSPAPPELRETRDFLAAWGGIASCQSTLGVLLAGVHAGRAGLEAVVAAVSANVAARFGLPEKGTITIGRDADFVLIDLARSWTLKGEELLYRHPLSALVGQPMRGTVRHVFSRGREVVPHADARADAHRGRLLRPVRAA